VAFIFEILQFRIKRSDLADFYGFSSTLCLLGGFFSSSGPGNYKGVFVLFVTASFSYRIWKARIFA
jgi:hypothetical protein